MRKAWTLLSWAIAAPALLAQAQPPAAAQPAPSLDPTKNRLDALLLQWEQKMKTVSALQAEVVRYETDSVAKTTKAMQGQAKLRRPDQASLILKSATNANDYEQFIFTGTFLWHYHPQFKRVRVYEASKAPGQPVDDNFLSFLFGMKAEDAKRRYNLSLKGEDANYVYIMVEPKLPADRQDFTAARLVLWQNTFLPRQLEFEAPNKDVTKWDIPRLDPAAKVTPADFTPPKPPADWTVERIPRQPTPSSPTATPQPTKVRPTGG